MQQQFSHITIIGIPGGVMCNRVVRVLEQRSLFVRVCMPHAILGISDSIPDGQCVLPVAIDAGYSAGDLVAMRDLCVRMRLTLLPLGVAEAWDAVVPLEMPELAAIEVESPESGWVERAFVTTESSEPTVLTDGSCMVNGTKVWFTFPDLTEPLAVIDSKAVITTPTAPASVASPSAKGRSAQSSRRKSAQGSAPRGLIILVALLFVMVVTCVLWLVMGVGEKVNQPESEAEAGAPVYADGQEQAGGDVVPYGHDCAAHLNDSKIICLRKGYETCPKCQHKLKVLNHECPEDGSENFEAKLKSGVDIGCAECAKGLALREHKCPEEGAENLDSNLKSGADIGCAECAKRLALREHKCPEEGAENYSELLKAGKNVGCQPCAAKLAELHECPGEASADRKATEEGSELGCETCKKRLGEMTAHDGKCPGDDSTERNALEIGSKLGCEKCSARLKQLDDHAANCPGKDSADPVATESGSKLGCATCTKRFGEMKTHSEKCPGADSVKRRETAAGCKLGCETCKGRQAMFDEHENKCPGKASSSDTNALKKGVDLGCSRCAAQLKKLKQDKKSAESAETKKPAEAKKPEGKADKTPAPAAAGNQSKVSKEQEAFNKKYGPCPDMGDVKGKKAAAFKTYMEHRERKCPRCLTAQ